jgi:hypothetical protein
MTLPKPLIASVALLLFAMPVFAWPVQPLMKRRVIYLHHTKMCVDGDDCDTHLLGLIMRILSKRGSVGVESRKMRLTIRDETERVKRVFKLIKCYDNSRLPPDQRKNECS